MDRYRDRKNMARGMLHTHLSKEGQIKLLKEGQVDIATDRQISLLIDGQIQGQEGYGQGYAPHSPSNREIDKLFKDGQIDRQMDRWMDKSFR